MEVNADFNLQISWVALFLLLEAATVVVAVAVAVVVAVAVAVAVDVVSTSTLLHSIKPLTSPSCVAPT